MAWRIEHCVERGEIDNRERGRVRGRIWLAGRKEPLTLDLTGNAHADLAGRLLTFRRREPAVRDSRDLFTEQRGVAGDLTASRKYRAFDLPADEALAQIRLGARPPEHLANGIYLEWYSERNGRVVIESTDFAVEVSDAEWTMTPEEEQAAQEAAAAAFARFMDQLGRVIDEKRVELPEDHEWTEFDYERLMRESDARTDKYGELLDKFGRGSEAEEHVAREMGWISDDESSGAAQGDEESGEPFAESFDWDDDEPLVPDATTEGTDWIRAPDGDIRHPLAHQAQEGALRLTRELREREDHLEFCFGYQMTAAKLAGALNSLAYGRGISDGAFTVAALKRALSHLHGAQAALEREARQVTPEIATRVREELFAIREAILALMQEFRET